MADVVQHRTDRLPFKLKLKELKPPPDIVEAIQQSEDGTAPPKAEVLEGIGANREIAARILFEKPVKAKELGIELRHEGPKPSKLDKYVRWLDTLLSNGITT
eukprot:jgi/Chrzof1/5916/Cz16g20170.t1